MAKLIIHSYEGQREVELEGVNPVGRHPQNRISIQDSLISKEHCLIFRNNEGSYVLKDLGSRNGTFVNARRVAGEAPLRDGDIVTLGTTKCRFVGASGRTGDVGARLDGTTIVVRKRAQELAKGRFAPEGEIRDLETLREDYEKLRAAHDIQRDIGVELNIDRIFRKILDRTFDFLTCDRAVIITFGEHGELHVRAFKTREGIESVTVSTTLIRLVQREKAGLVTADAQSDTRFDHAESMIRGRIRSSMAVPMLSGDELLGVMVIDSSSAVRAYSEKDLSLFTNIARQAAQYMKIAGMAKKIEADAATRARFQRLLSPDLAELVVSGKLRVEKGGESRFATVLFADIRGFTSICERMHAANVVTMLNDYYEIVVEAAFRHEGTIDKFVGDSVMVVWGAPVSHPDDPHRAVRAALDMQRALRGYNRARGSRGGIPVPMGIGINSDHVIAGYIGSTQTMSYSVIGDAVNVASRLCSAAEAGQVLISEKTRGYLGGEFSVAELPPLMVKGKTEPLKAFSLHDIGEREAGRRSPPDKQKQGE